MHGSFVLNAVQHGTFQTTNLISESDVRFPNGHVGRNQNLEQSKKSKQASKQANKQTKNHHPFHFRVETPV